MQSKISAIRLGVENLARSRRFYTKGFGWSVDFESGERICFDMGGGLLLETWQQVAFEAELGRFAIERPGPCALAIAAGSRGEVEALGERLLAAGGWILQSGRQSRAGGYRIHVSDPDCHAWQIGWDA